MLRRIAAWLLLCACASTVQADLADTVALVKPAIAAVGTYQHTRRPPAKFRGTGFMLRGGRYLVTNAHNLPEELNSAKHEFLAVFFSGDSSEMRKARVISEDREHDLALLRIDGEARPHGLELDGSDKVREGEEYAFTGFPIGAVLGLRPATHQALISAITPIAIPQLSAHYLSPRVIKRLDDPYDIFQLDATAYPGNSGSPVYHPQTGRVVAVINKVFVKESREHVLDKPSGISYAIPARHIRTLLEKADISLPSQAE